MSNSMDVHFSSTRDYPVISYAIGRAVLFTVFPALLFLCGCGPNQQAVDLYVDAVMLREFDENEMAIEKLNTAVELNDRFSLAYSLLGEIYQEMKDYEKSAAAYEKATEADSWSFKDYFNLGRVYDAMKRFAKAVRAYAKACEINPEHLDAHLSAAKSFYQLKEYDSALAYSQRAELIDPNVSEVQQVLGDIYESQKDHEHAIRSYKRALEIDSNDVEVMISLAISYLRTSRNEPARELLTSVIEMEPDNGKAYQYLGYCYLRFYDRAVQAYKAESGRDDVAPQLLDTLMKDAETVLERAVESYNMAIAINKEDWEAYRGLGVAYMIMALNEDNNMLKSKAVYQWRLSLEANPDQPRRERLDKLIEKYSKR